MQIYKKNELLCIDFCIKAHFWWAEVDSKHVRILQAFIYKALKDALLIRSNFSFILPFLKAFCAIRAFLLRPARIRPAFRKSQRTARRIP